MYPERELSRLAAHKAVLRSNIALRRATCAQAAARVAQPLRWVDRGVAVWRRLSPLTRLAAVPLGLLAARPAFARLKFLGPLLRWGPVLYGVVRGLRARPS